MNIIESYNINYKDIHNLSLSIEEGSIVSIIGENASGKSSLLKLLSGAIITDSSIKLDSIQINKYNIEEINKRVSYISSYNEFFSRTVMEEIIQEKKNVDIYELNKVRKLLDKFNLLYLENESVQNLSYAENQIIALIKAIIKNPKVLIIDNGFSRLDNDKRKELFDYITNYCKEKKITIIFTSNHIEDIKYSERILVLNNYNISFDGNYKELINSFNILKGSFKIPWERELLNKLKLYGLIEDYFDSDNLDELVGVL